MAETGRYKMGTIARLTDFSPALIRVWERRHDLLKPERTAGGHRLYTEQDLRVLLQVRDMVAAGHSIGEIAGVGRANLLQRSYRRKARGAQASMSQAMGQTPPEEGLSAASLEQWRDRLVQATQDLDETSMEEALDQAFAILSPLRVAHAVISPAACRIGDLWATGQCSIASEHLASHAFTRRLSSLLKVTNRRGDGAIVVCACYPEENHQIGLLVVACDLAETGHRVHFLGPSVPFGELERIHRILRPRAFYLSVTSSVLYHRYRKELQQMVGRIGSDAKFVVGGQGVPSEDLDLLELNVELVNAT